MTILTKPFEKKGDKLIVPLVADDKTASAPPNPNDVESVITLRVRARRVSTLTTVCLLLTALLVVSFGVLGGTYLYRQYLRSQTHRFKGWAHIPYNRDDIRAMSLNDNQRFINTEDMMNSDMEKMIRNFFQEEIELDLDNQEYEKIDVPNFRDGRSGRFIHDFNTNITGIIDVTGNRCFVMPLNRNNVLPPKSFFDLVHKMLEGYYRIDTDVVRKNMRVITPPITDTTEVGSYISEECRGRPIYKLEKDESRIEKRSADLHSEAKFAQFSGKGIMEVDIINFDDVQKYESGSKL